ncbi:hypothetical protein LXL04_007791 [Taraxacum kok-saghyz]
MQQNSNFTIKQPSHVREFNNRGEGFEEQDECRSPTSRAGWLSGAIKSLPQLEKLHLCYNTITTEDIEIIGLKGDEFFKNGGWIFQECFGFNMSCSHSDVANNEDELTKLIKRLQEVDSGITLCNSSKGSSSRSAHVENILGALVPDVNSIHNPVGIRNKGWASDSEGRVLYEVEPLCLHHLFKCMNSKSKRETVNNEISQLTSEIHDHNNSSTASLMAVKSLRILQHQSNAPCHLDPTTSIGSLVPHPIMQTTCLFEDRFPTHKPYKSEKALDDQKD